MPVVDKNQLKIWFKNLAKPVQEQFWNWMDSFYHKSEPIPKSAIENLTTDLAKKADLVGGVVPASQLPFSVNTSEVIAIGTISATENTVTLAVHSSGSNVVRVSGVVLIRNFPNTFTFTPVTDGSKFLILYAINDSGIFRIAEGVEGLEALEPELPAGALYVRRILVNSSGSEIEMPTLTGFKEKKEDNWKIFSFSQTDVPMFLPFSDGRASFLLLSENSLAGNFILGGFARNNTSENWWSGKELTILNNTGSSVNLQHIVGFDEQTQATFRANYILKNNETVKVKVLQDGDLVEIMAASVDVSGKLDKGGYAGTANDIINEISEEATFRYDADVILNNGINTANALIATKQDRLQSVSSNVGVGKSDASATEKLDVNGRIKSDGIVLNETSGAILPKQIKFKDGKFKAALSDGVEKAFILEGDTNQSNTLIKFIHKGNRIIQPTAMDYTTSYVTAPNHGFTHIGQLLVGIFGTTLVNNEISIIHPYYVVPFEWQTSITYVKVIDANTLLICDVNGNAIIANPNQAQNLNRNDITKWHIEDYGILSTPDIIQGYKRVTIKITGLAGSSSRVSVANRYFKVVLLNSSNVKEYNNIQSTAGFSGSSFHNNNQFMSVHRLDVASSLYAIYTNIEKASYSGVSTALLQNNQNFIYTTINNKGIVSIYAPSNENYFANGTEIEIYLD